MSKDTIISRSNPYVYFETAKNGSISTKYCRSFALGMTNN